MTLGFATCIHVISEYYEVLHHQPARNREENRAAVERALQETGLTVAVNGFTTMLGFMALVTSSHAAGREIYSTQDAVRWNVGAVERIDLAVPRERLGAGG